MTEAGNPTFKWDKQFPYDFPYLAAAVDILEPECYGRIGDWERVKPGWFQQAYARWAAPHLPFFWAEAGVSAWAPSQGEATEDLLDFQAQYYRDLYRMFVGSCSDGIFFWWYPGGYRVNERSDYGIIEPDGTDRPVTRVIRENGQALLNGPSEPAPDCWFEVDRDAHSAGAAGVYDDVETAFWDAIAQGKTPGLRTSGTGTTSVDCPLLAVGNTPCNGHNPPKYLDGFFDRIEVYTHGREWQEIWPAAPQDGPSEPAAALRITLTNLGEARWLSPLGRDAGGAVFLLLEGDGGVRQELGLPEDMARFDTRTITWTLPEGEPVPDAARLRVEARGRSSFGPSPRLVLSP